MHSRPDHFDLSPQGRSRRPLAPRADVTSAATRGWSDPPHRSSHRSAHPECQPACGTLGRPAVAREFSRAAVVHHGPFEIPSALLLPAPADSSPAIGAHADTPTGLPLNRSSRRWPCPATSRCENLLDSPPTPIGSASQPAQNRGCAKPRESARRHPGFAAQISAEKRTQQTAKQESRSEEGASLAWKTCSPILACSPAPCPQSSSPRPHRHAAQDQPSRKRPSFDARTEYIRTWPAILCTRSRTERKVRCGFGRTPGLP